LLDNYQSLADLALAEFEDIITRTAFIGGTPASPNKLRLVLIDDSFLDVWLSVEGEYAYHWEQRRQHGQFHRWDNAPHHPRVASYPAHFHDGDEDAVVESDLDPSPEAALRQVLSFVRRRLS
jgi:hypothetical protein